MATASVSVICGDTGPQVFADVYYVRWYDYGDGSGYVPGQWVDNSFFLSIDPPIACITNNTPLQGSNDCCTLTAAGVVHQNWGAQAMGNSSIEVDITNNVCCLADGTCIKGTPNCDGTCSEMMRASAPITAPPMDPQRAKVLAASQKLKVKFATKAAKGGCGCGK